MRSHEAIPCSRDTIESSKSPSAHATSLAAQYGHMDYFEQNRDKLSIEALKEALSQVNSCWYKYNGAPQGGSMRAYIQRIIDERKR